MRVDWSEPAISDLEGIWDFLSRDSPYYATRTVNRLVEAVEPLQTFPNMGRHIPEASARDARELVVGSYRSMYQVEDERVLVVAVMHGRRDLKALGEPWDPTQR